LLQTGTNNKSDDALKTDRRRRMRNESDDAKFGIPNPIKSTKPIATSMEK